jgi:hypothetical protein
MKQSMNDLAASIINMDEVNTDEVVMTSIAEATWIQFRVDNDEFALDMMDEFDDVEFVGSWMIASPKVFKDIQKLAKKAGVKVESK